MAATDTGQTRVVPLQNVAYDMSQQINYLLTVKSPPKTELKKPQRLYAHVAESLCFNVFFFFTREDKGVYSRGRYWHSIFSRHQQVIPGHKCAATVGVSDGSGMARGERGGGGRKVVGWLYNFNPFTDRTP